MDKIVQCIETIKNELTWFLNNMNPNDYQGAEDDNELVNSLLTMNRSASNFTVTRHHCVSIRKAAKGCASNKTTRTQVRRGNKL